jgi:signal transduction histidine kinase
MTPVRIWFREHPLAADCVIAVAFFALGLLSVRIAHDVGATQGHNFRFATGVACMALLTLPLAWRRRRPPLSLIGLTIGILGYTVFGVTEGATTGTAGFLAIYSVGAYCPRRVANWVRGVCITILFGDLLWILLFRQLDLNHSKASVVGAGLLTIGSNVFFFAAAWVIGDVARASKARSAELALRNTELAAAQDVIAAQAVLDERVRIAREVHDVVAHHVSVMGVQAGAARRVMGRDPIKAAEVLTSIEASSRQAVAELQRLLGFLRREPPAVAADATSTGVVAAPPPSLSQLGALVAEMNEAGLVVSAVTEGTPRPVPPSVDLSAYRVAQEALTNALKHAGAGTAAVVTLSYTPTGLELSIVDDGRGRSNGRSDHPMDDPNPTGGHGLLGMRERVALSGGQFHATRTRGSGFAVTATFPS